MSKGGGLGEGLETGANSTDSPLIGMRRFPTWPVMCCLAESGSSWGRGVITALEVSVMDGMARRHAERRPSICFLPTGGRTNRTRVTRLPVALDQSRLRPAAIHSGRFHFST